MADLSKLRFNGTDYNVKDASAPTRKFTNAYSKTGNLPISSDDTTQTAIGKLENNIIPKSAKGTANGVAELDANGKVPSSQLPSYVDDVLEYSAKSSFPATGESGKIYVDTTTNKTYRWSGSAYVEISESLALGETDSTAYRGDRGKTAYNHSQVTSGNPHNVTKTDVGLSNVGNFKAVSTVASQGLSNTEKSNARANIGAGTGNGTYSKPSGGIPKSDLASAVQTSLDQVNTNKTNISYTLGKTGKNLFDFDAWIDGLTVTNGSLTKSGNAITITATANDAYTNRFNVNKADAYKIAAKSGETIVIQWDADLTQASHGGLVYVFPNGNNAGMSYASASTEKIVFTVPSDCDFVTVRFGVSNSGETIAYSNIMICTQEDWDVSPDYQPYSGLSNFALTELENKNTIYNFSTGVKNLFNFDAWKDVEIERGTKTIGDNSMTIAATSADAYTKYGTNYPETVKIYVQTGDVICLSWDYTPNNSQIDDKAYIFGFGSNPTTPVSSSNTYSQTEYLEYTVPATVQYVEIRFGVTTNGYSATYANIMICTKAVWDQEPNVYRPFALPNYDLTQLEQQDRNALVEVVDEGAKNKFDLSVKEAAKTTNITVTKTANSITVTSNTSTNEAYVSYPIYIDKAGKYVITATFSNVNLERNTAILRFANTATGGLVYTLTITDNGTLAGEFDISTAGTYWLLFAPNWAGATAVNTYTASDIMVCSEADWKISQNFAQYALPNTDLTQLEAEDRAALVEVIDKGAKNLFDYDTVTIASGGFVIPNTPMILAEGSYEISYTTNQSESDNAEIGFLDANMQRIVVHTLFSQSGRNKVVLTIPTGKTSAYIYMYSRQGGTFSDFMVCTESEAKISPSYQPYRKNLDQLEATKAPMLSGSITSGDLNDVTINTFAMYANTVSSLPTSDNYYVETSVFDASSLLQRAYNIATAESYVRVKCVGTWSAWKQITNA